MLWYQSFWEFKFNFFAVAGLAVCPFSGRLLFNLEGGYSFTRHSWAENSTKNPINVCKPPPNASSSSRLVGQSAFPFPHFSPQPLFLLRGLWRRPKKRATSSITWVTFPLSTLFCFTFIGVGERNRNRRWHSCNGTVQFAGFGGHGERAHSTVTIVLVFTLEILRGASSYQDAVIRRKWRPQRNMDFPWPTQTLLRISGGFSSMQIWCLMSVES